MNSTQAKNLHLPDLMARLGYQPVKVVKGGAKYWYDSPFRKEKEASLNVSRGRKWNWVWNDFGDIGGNVVDFIMRLQNCSFKEALTFLDDVYERERIIIPRNRVGEAPTDHEQHSFSFYQQHQGEALEKKIEETLEFIRADTITNPLIHRYLVQQRYIPRPLIDRYLKEVRYYNHTKGKFFFAFGMENMSGGYEVRSASTDYDFKSALKSRDISVIYGGAYQDGTVNIFEGMTDFLSLCAMYQVQQLRYDSIIMHSLSSYGRVGEWLSKKDYHTLNLFLDNDDAGKDCVARYEKEFAGKVIDQSGRYAPHKDVNDAWVEHQRRC